MLILAAIVTASTCASRRDEPPHVRAAAPHTGRVERNPTAPRELVQAMVEIARTGKGPAHGQRASVSCSIEVLLHRSAAKPGAAFALPSQIFTVRSDVERRAEASA